MNVYFYKSASLALLFLISTAGAARAQVASNPPYQLEQSVIAGGGGTSGATNGTNAFSIDGTIGQSIAGGALSNSPFSVTSGFWNYSAAVPNPLGLEADIATRPLGDSLFQSADLIQLRRFLNGADVPETTANNEFQRADSAPSATRGDGALCSSDLIQLRRYLNGADAPQTAGGASAQTGSCGATAQAAALAQTGLSNDAEAESKMTADKAQAPEAARELRVESPPATGAGQTVTVNIRVDALGDESAYAFRLNYNQAVLTNPVFNDGTTRAAIVDCDASVTNRIGCVVEAFPTNNPTSGSTSIREIGAGDNQLLLSITFTIAAGAQTQTIPLTLSNVSTSNDRAQNLAITATGGAVTVTGPTAATVSVGGRVMTASGRGIRNARVTLTDARGNVRTAISTAFGYYSFDNVEAGATYIISASGKRYTFSPPSQVLNVNEETNQVNIIADSEKRSEDF